MRAGEPGAGERRGFAEHGPRTRVRLERGASAALSGGIVGLLLAGLALGLVGGPQQARPDHSPAIRTFDLAAPQDRRIAKPEHERRGTPAQRTTPEPRPVAKPPAIAALRQAAALMVPDASDPPVLSLPPSAIMPPSTPRPLPPAAESPPALDAYRQQLWALIAARRPPGIHLDGEVGIAFDLDPDGGLCSATIIRSSGDPMMDRLALGTVRRAAPFPKPPLQDPASLTFEIGFHFR